MTQLRQRLQIFPAPRRNGSRRPGLLRDVGALRRGTRVARVADQMIDVILELRAAHFEFFDLLVGGEIYFLFNAIDFVVEPVVFVVQVAEVEVGTLQALDGFAMFGKLAQDGMMQFHGLTSSFLFDGWLVEKVATGQEKNRHATAGRTHYCGETAGLPLASAGRHLVDCVFWL